MTQGLISCIPRLSRCVFHCATSVLVDFSEKIFSDSVVYLSKCTYASVLTYFGTNDTLRSFLIYISWILPQNDSNLIHSQQGFFAHTLFSRITRTLAFRFHLVLIISFLSAQLPCKSDISSQFECVYLVGDEEFTFSNLH